jgi:uncharacterized protein YecT (DUF1311 family)
MMVAVLLALPISGTRQEPTQKADTCFDTAKTQADINNCAAYASNKADAELNRVYQQLLRNHAGQKNYIAKLEVAQEAWVKFRNAHVEFLYPELNEGQVRAEGTAYPMCRAMEITRLTRERIKDLESLLNPKEGDVCGS